LGIGNSDPRRSSASSSAATDERHRVNDEGRPIRVQQVDDLHPPLALSASLDQILLTIATREPSRRSVHDAFDLDRGATMCFDFSDVSRDPPEIEGHDLII
jgi:hypothetical protein